MLPPAFERWRSATRAWQCASGVPHRQPSTTRPPESATSPSGPTAEWSGPSSTQWEEFVAVLPCLRPAGQQASGPLSWRNATGCCSAPVTDCQSSSSKLCARGVHAAQNRRDGSSRRSRSPRRGRARRHDRAGQRRPGPDSTPQSAASSRPPNFPARRVYSSGLVASRCNVLGGATGAGVAPRPRSATVVG